MSEELKKKLYDYEVNPPGVMWSKISAALDEAINASFPKRLYDAQITPPSGFWNKIAAELDATKNEDYPEKLYDLEVEPPATSWEKIAASLYMEKGLSPIRPKGNIIAIVRYAVAACLIGAIALGGYKFLNRKAPGQSIAGPTRPQNNYPIAIERDSSKNPAPSPHAVSNNLPKEGTAMAKTNFTLEKKTFSQAGYMVQGISPVSSDRSSISDLNFRQASLTGDIPGSCSLISDADRYLMFMNPDGYLIRISKKLAEALGCFYANGNSKEYKQCDDQIKKWRDKIAQSRASSSPDNFMDIIDIIKSAQE